MREFRTTQSLTDYPMLTEYSRANFFSSCIWKLQAKDTSQKPLRYNFTGSWLQTASYLRHCKGVVESVCRKFFTYRYSVGLDTWGDYNYHFLQGQPSPYIEKYDIGSTVRTVIHGIAMQNEVNPDHSWHQEMMDLWMGRTKSLDFYDPLVHTATFHWTTPSYPYTFTFDYPVGIYARYVYHDLKARGLICPFTSAIIGSNYTRCPVGQMRHNWPGALSFWKNALCVYQVDGPQLSSCRETIDFLQKYNLPVGDKYFDCESSPYSFNALAYSHADIYASDTDDPLADDYNNGKYANEHKNIPPPAMMGDFPIDYTGNTICADGVTPGYAGSYRYWVYNEGKQLTGDHPCWQGYIARIMASCHLLIGQCKMWITVGDAALAQWIRQNRLLQSGSFIYSGSKGYLYAYQTCNNPCGSCGVAYTTPAGTDILSRFNTSVNRTSDEFTATYPMADQFIHIDDDTNFVVSPVYVAEQEAARICTMHTVTGDADGYLDLNCHTYGSLDEQTFGGYGKNIYPLPIDEEWEAVLMCGPSENIKICGNDPSPDVGRACTGLGYCPRDENQYPCGGLNRGYCTPIGTCLCMASWTGIACNVSYPLAFLNTPSNTIFSDSATNLTTQAILDAMCGMGNGATPLPLGQSGAGAYALLTVDPLLVDWTQFSNGVRSRQYGVPNFKYLPLCQCFPGWGPSIAEIAALAEQNTTYIGRQESIFFIHDFELSLYANFLVRHYHTSTSLGNDATQYDKTGWTAESFTEFLGIRLWEYAVTHQCVLWMGGSSDVYETGTYKTDTAHARIAPVYSVDTERKYTLGSGYVFRNITPGYRCVNQYGWDPFGDIYNPLISTNARTGRDCSFVCPPCDLRHGTCEANYTSKVAYCKCDFNYGGLDCGTPICPWNTQTQSQPCNGGITGRCLSNVANPSAGYIGRCECYQGWTGTDCSTTPCPIDPAHPHTGPCGIHPIQINNQTNAVTQYADARGTCDTTTGKCICTPREWSNGLLPSSQAACQLPACPFDPMNLECGGLWRTDHSDLVCDRPSRTCQCWLNKTITPTLVRFQAFDQNVNYDSVHYGTDLKYGNYCQFTYYDACTGDNGQWCSGHGHFCLPKGSHDVFNLATPECGCNMYRYGLTCSNHTCPTDCNSDDETNCIPRCNSTSAALGHINCDDTTSAYTRLNHGHCICRGRPGGIFYTGVHCSIRADGCYAGVGKEACSGNGDCVPSNTTAGAYVCLCKPGYINGTNPPCSVQTCITCNGIGQMCAGVGTSAPQCICKPNYVGASCDIEVCRSTGGTPINASSNSNTNNPLSSLCRCPSGSIFYPLDTEVTPLTSAFKGCRKTCPVYNGIECGARRTQYGSCADGNENIPAVVNFTASTDSSVHCACNFSAPPPYGANDDLKWWVLNPATNACEEYCKNGGFNAHTDTQAFPVCSCTDPRYTGSRCDVRVCNSRGKLVNGICSCSSWAYYGSSCQNDRCAPGGSYSLTTNKCVCNNTLYDISDDGQKCIHKCQSGSIPDPATGGMTCKNCPPVYGGTRCHEKLCRYESTPNAASTACVCASTHYPQFGGLFCNTSICLNGGSPRPYPNFGCNCKTPFYGGADGRCSINYCTRAGGNLTNTTGHAICNCPPGYANQTINGVFSFCSKYLCAPGVLETCPNPAECLDPQYNYNCKCGTAYRFQNGTCVFLGCGDTGKVVYYGGSGAGTPISSCQCLPGFTGATCNVSVCTNPKQYYDVGSNTCKCVFPWIDPTCEEHQCGPHSSDDPVLTNAALNIYACQCNEGYHTAEHPLLDGTYPCVPACFQDGTTNLWYNPHIIHVISTDVNDTAFNQMTPYQRHLYRLRHPTTSVTYKYFRYVNETCICKTTPSGYWTGQLCDKFIATAHLPTPSPPVPQGPNQTIPDFTPASSKRGGVLWIIIGSVTGGVVVIVGLTVGLYFYFKSLNKQGTKEKEKPVKKSEVQRLIK